MKFSLKQLKYANEVCFRDDFIRLFNKYAESGYNPNLKDCGAFYESELVHQFGNDLLRFIFHFSRADLGKGYDFIFDGMLKELIGDYR